jgi:hypothetical protein
MLQANSGGNAFKGISEQLDIGGAVVFNQPAGALVVVGAVIPMLTAVQMGQGCRNV